MPNEQTVLITGVGEYWGSHVAARLLTIPGIRVIGVDTAPPKEALEGLDFIQADVRNPLLADLLAEEGVNTIVHLAFLDTQHPSEAAFDVNVMGTMKVFGAAASAGVTKIVVKSTMMVYGAKPDNSAFLPEERGLAAKPELGSLRDLVEIEAFCNGFRAQYPEITLTVLRFPGVVGPTANTIMTALSVIAARAGPDGF